MPEYEYLVVKREGQSIRITMNRPDRRNALSAAHLEELLDAFTRSGDSDATGIILAGNGPVFCSGHDFADVDSSDLRGVRRMIRTCTELMLTMHRIPQVVVARVHALATAAGCQLVASCDLAVASESATFALPGGKGGWFCHTPAVAVARNIARKHVMELALCGDPIDARTAEAFGLINYAVPDADLDERTDELLARATRGYALAKGVGKQTLYAQLDRPEVDAYMIASEVMTMMSQTSGAREARRAFLERRAPVWPTA